MAELADGQARRAPQGLARMARPVTVPYAAVMRAIHAVGWARIRWTLGAGYVLYLTDLVVHEGVPTGRKTLAYIVVTGLAITCLGRGWRRMALVVFDWLPFTFVLIIYDRSRAIAGTMGMPLHEVDIARAEQWLFGGQVPAVWMQQHFYDPAHVHLYDAVATLVYTSHFVITPLLAAVYWVRDRAMWLRYSGRVVLLSFAGLATYVLFPEAPPWMASQDGYIGPITRLSARGWQYLHAGFADELLRAGQNGGANPVAAMPSLHLAFAVLATVVVYERARWRWRRLLWLYPVAMGVTLVYTGEHYVIDLLFGAVYALGVHWVLTRAEVWGRARFAPRVSAVTVAVEPAEPAPESVGAM